MLKSYTHILWFDGLKQIIGVSIILRSAARPKTENCTSQRITYYHLRSSRDLKNPQGDSKVQRQ